MKFDFAVLGATGEQGAIASRDLLESGASVLLCGRNDFKIKHLLKHKKAQFAYVDLNNVGKTAQILKRSGAPIVLNCAELRLNLKAMKACLKAKVHYLDLGGLQDMTIQQYKLNAAFKKIKRLALLGCGSTPGIANVMAAHAVQEFDRVDHIDLGFFWNSNIKTFVLPYSFESIVHELTTDPIVLESGRFKKMKACSLEGVKEFFGVGKQQIYCIVHSEVYTFYKHFKKKGIQAVHYKAGFPEHSFKVLKTLMDLGFASKEPITVEKQKIIPLEFTSLMLRKIVPPKRYQETEVIWVTVSGLKKGKSKRVEMDCLVKPVKGWTNVGSNVDTGRTISVMAQMLKAGDFSGVGITAPEAIVPADKFFKEIQKRGMQVYRNRKKL